MRMIKIDGTPINSIDGLALRPSSRRIKRSHVIKESGKQTDAADHPDDKDEGIDPARSKPGSRGAWTAAANYETRTGQRATPGDSPEPKGRHKNGVGFHQAQRFGQPQSSGTGNHSGDHHFEHGPVA